MAAASTYNAKPSQPPSVIHHKTLNPDCVYTFDLLPAQQTPAGTYLLILYFSSSGPVIRMKCGKDGCRSTANPTDTLPITCANNFTPHIHYKYDMVPCLFTVIPSNGVQTCSSKSPDGVPIPSPISIVTPASPAFFHCRQFLLSTFLFLHLHFPLMSTPSSHPIKLYYLLRRSFPFFSVRRSSYRRAKPWIRPYPLLSSICPRSSFRTIVTSFGGAPHL